MPTLSRFIEAAEPSGDVAVALSTPFSKIYCCQLDFRGETLVYIEPDRTTSMRCVLTDGYMIEASTIQIWCQNNGTNTPVSEEDRLEVVRRVVRYAAQVQGVVMAVST